MFTQLTDLVGTMYHLSQGELEVFPTIILTITTVRPFFLFFCPYYKIRPPTCIQNFAGLFLMSPDPVFLSKTGGHHFLNWACGTPSFSFLRWLAIGRPDRGVQPLPLSGGRPRLLPPRVPLEASTHPSGRLAPMGSEPHINVTSSRVFVKCNGLAPLPPRREAQRLARPVGICFLIPRSSFPPSISGRRGHFES